MKPITRIALAVALLLGSVSAWGVPAYRGLVQMKDAQGRPMNVRIVGDENFSYYLSEDGCMLLPGRDSQLYYAQKSADGIVRPSKIAATAPSLRTPQDREMLRAVDQADLRATLTSQPNARRVPTSHPATPTTSDFNFPKTGQPKTLVLLVSFSDVDFKTANPHEHFTNMLNQEGYSDYLGGGSARDYFIATSCGKFAPEFDVIGPIKLDQTEEHYGQQTEGGTHDLQPWYMVIDACRQIDPEVDFSQYDEDGDGVIDNVFVFYAGEGQATGGASWTIWPHASNIAQVTNVMLDGKQLNHYSCTNEWWGTTVGIGTFTHEFSHVLGLPDLYCTNGDNSPYTPMEYSIMDQGPYNNYGHTPPYYTAWERFCMGWLTPDEISDTCNARLEPLGTSNSAYLISTPNPDEYFLLENRQLQGWDQYLPGHGMLIWHILYNKQAWDQNIVNNNFAQQLVDLEEADNRQDYDTRDGDPFPGSTGKTSFTHDTKPSMKTWGNNNLYLPITDIAESEDGIITFKVAGGYEAPDAPTGLHASVIEENAITVAWEPVDGVKNYILNVYTKQANEYGYTENIPLEGYSDLNVKKVTEYRITGLTLGQTYYVTVKANTFDGPSEASAELAVTTDKVGINGINMTPQATEYYDLQGRRLRTAPTTGLYIERSTVGTRIRYGNK